MSLDKTPGKRERVEIVTTRLTPELKYLAEIAARAHHQSISRFMEHCVEQTLRTLHLGHPHGMEGVIQSFGADGPIAGDDGAQHVPSNVSSPLSRSLWAERKELWDASESKRFINLARHYPHLLSTSERAIRSVILQTLHWTALERNRKSAVVDIEQFIHENWHEIKDVADSGSDLPLAWPRRASPPAKHSSKPKGSK